MKPRQSFQLDDSELLTWLEAQGNKSDIIRQALIEYRRDQHFSEKSESQVEQLLEIRKTWDEELRELLDRVRKLTPHDK